MTVQRIAEALQAAGLLPDDGGTANSKLHRATDAVQQCLALNWRPKP